MKPRTFAGLPCLALGSAAARALLIRLLKLRFEPWAFASVKLTHLPIDASPEIPPPFVFSTEPADDRWMQNVAAEMNLSETAFARRLGTGSKFSLRWFTPRVEVDLCGHATLATAHILWEEGHLPDKRSRPFRDTQRFVDRRAHTSRHRARFSQRAC